MVNIDKITKLFDNISEYIFKIKLYPYQLRFARRILESVFNDEGAEIISLFARQSGKSETVACVSLFLLIVYPKVFKKPIRIGIFAPKFEQANITFERIRLRFSNLVKYCPKYNVNRFKWGNSIEIFEGSVVRCISASEGTTIEGETFDLILTEETQDISNRKLTKSIFPMGAATAATRILIGTATFHKCYFWDVSEKLKGTKDGFYIHWEEAAKFNKRYEKYVTKEKDRIGEESDEFRASYCLEWRLEYGQFITYEQLIEKLFKGNEERDVVEKYNGTAFAGIDVAKSPDSTVVTIGRVNKEGKLIILNWLELEGEDYADQAEIVSAYLKRYNVKQVLVDIVGVGDPFRDILRRMAERGTQVLGFRWSTISHHNAFKALSYYINRGDIVCPYSENVKKSIYFRKFVDQFSNLERKYVGSFMKCHHPDMPNAHDDYASSLSLLVWLALGRFNIQKIFGGKKQSDPIGDMRKLNREQMEEKKIAVHACETIVDKLNRLKRVQSNKII